MAEEQREIKRRKRPDELVKAIRALDKGVQVAIDRLIKLCDSNDEKIALDASKGLLKLLSDMKMQADERDLKKILAQVKLTGGMKFAPEEDDDTPVVDFTNVQQID